MVGQFIHFKWAFEIEHVDKATEDGEEMESASECSGCVVDL